MNCIPIELCPEDRARLDRIIKALEIVTCAGEVKQEQPEQTSPATVAPETENPVRAESAPQAKAPDIVEPVVDESAVVPETIPNLEEDIRQAYIRLARTPKKATAQGIIREHADKISGIPASKQAKVLERLTALEAEA